MIVPLIKFEHLGVGMTSFRHLTVWWAFLFVFPERVHCTSMLTTDGMDCGMQIICCILSGETAVFNII